MRDLTSFLFFLGAWLAFLFRLACGYFYDENPPSLPFPFIPPMRVLAHMH